jgi:hypothetical protein
MRSNLFILAALTLTVGPSLVGAGFQSAPSGLPIPYEDAGARPFEGCVYRDWQANDTVAVRTTRSANAPTVHSSQGGHDPRDPP